MSTTEFRKIKLTKNGGIELIYRELIPVEDTVSKTDVTKKSKDNPHPDFRTALEDFDEVVRYDEGYPKKTEVNVTGVTLVGGEVIIITHTKVKKSGAASTNSGRISRESETFDTKMAERAFDLWDILVNEAEEYLKGKRAQLNIFSPEAQDDSDKVSADKEKALEAV